MNRQRGVALSGLIFWGVVIAMLSMLGLKVGPEVVDYYKIVSSVKSVAKDAGGKTVPEIRAAYAKYAEVNHTKTISPSDLSITKEGGQVVISFAYESRIPLFANVSLLIDFEGSSSGSGGS
jgi:hypothetical protein